MKKRFLKCLTTALLALTTFLSITGIAEEMSYEDYQMYVDLLSSLSIVDGTYNAIFGPETEVSREVVNYSVAKLNYENYDSSKKTEITELEFIKLLVDYLGYDKLLTSKTDQNYLSQAISIDLTKGVNIKPENKLTGYVFARLMAQALETPQCGMVGGVWQTGKSYFEKEDIVSISGIVQTTEFASCAYENPCLEGYVVIDGETYMIGKLSLRDYLGYHVDAYAMEQDGIKVLLGVAATRRNKTLTIDADNIQDSGATSLTYLKDNYKKKTVRLTQDYALIYNNVTILKHPENILEPDLGNVTLIDADGNGQYETAKVKDYDVYVVSGIDSDRKRIYSENGQHFSYDSDVLVYSASINGEPIDVSKVKTKDILYVAISQNEKCVEVLGARKTVKGTLARTRKNDQYIECTIDGKEYNVNADLENELIVGSFYVAYQGPDGVIQKIEITRNEFYAILEKVWMSDDDEMVYYVKLFDQDGVEKTYTIHEKAKLFSPVHSGVEIDSDEISYVKDYIKTAFETTSTTYGHGMAAPIVVYSVRNGEIGTIGIPTARPLDKAATDRPEGAMWTATTLTDYVNVRTRNYWRASTRFFAPNYAGNNCDQAYKRPTDNTVVFTVKLDGKEMIPECISENASVKIGGFNAGTWIYGSFYNLDSDMGLGAMIMYETSSDTLGGSEGFIVQNVGVTLNKEQEVCVMLSGYDKKGEKDLILSPNATVTPTYINAFLKEDISSMNPSDISAGDFILYNEKDGEVVTAALMMSAARPDSEYSMIHNGNGYESYYEMLFGKVVEKTPNVLYVEITNKDYNSSENVHHIFGYKQASALVYDRASGKADKTNIDSINVGDTVFVRKLTNANVASILKIIN